MSKAHTIDRAVTTLVGLVPGLAVLVFGLGVPADFKVWFVIILQVFVFAVIALLMVREDEIKSYSTRKVAHKISWSLVRISVLLFFFFLVHKAVIVTYTSRDKTVTVLIPAHLTRWLNTVYVYGKCDQPVYHVCKPAAWDTAYTAAEVARQKEIHGEAGVIVRGGVWSLLWWLLFAVLYTGLVAHLVYLFGIAKIRRADIWQFMKAFP